MIFQNLTDFPQLILDQFFIRIQLPIKFISIIEPTTIHIEPKFFFHSLIRYKKRYQLENPELKTDIAANNFITKLLSSQHTCKKLILAYSLCVLSGYVKGAYRKIFCTTHS